MPIFQDDEDQYIEPKLNPFAAVSPDLPLVRDPASAPDGAAAQLALLQQQDDAARSRKSWLNAGSGIANALLNARSAAEIALKEPRSNIDYGATFRQAADNVATPSEQQQKAYAFLKAKRENDTSNEKSAFENKLKDETSSTAKAFKQTLISSGGDPAAINASSAFDLYTQGFSPAKMAEIKSRSAIDAMNKMKELEYGKNADLERLRVGKDYDLERTKAAKQADIEKMNAEPAKPDQTQAATFGRRLEQAEKVFSDLSAKKFNRANPETAAQTYLPAMFQSENLRKQDQAERNFVNAVLRRESGAAISKDEFDSAEKQYFPRPGDTPDILAQKQANRAQVKAGLQAAAGKKAWEQIPLITPPEKVSAAPEVGEVRKGHRFLGGDPSNPSSWEKVK